MSSADGWTALVEEGPADATEGETPLEQFLAQAALVASDDRVEGARDGVTLMTLHTAKGLEWPVVAISGMEDGLFPLARAEGSPEALDEERRLCYVGITRARDKLYLTWARSRRRNGELRMAQASQFLGPLRATGALEERQTSTWWGSGHTSAPRPTVNLFDDAEDESQDVPRYVKGERVRHEQFGSGTIVELDRRIDDIKVVVAFDDDTVGTKQLLAKFAGLERDWESA